MNEEKYMLTAGEVAQLLGDGVKIYAPDDNCRYTKYTLWAMKIWMYAWGDPVPDVIHWNNGIWDLHRVTADGLPFTPLDEYLDQNRRLAYQMESYCKNLIWATSTPGGRQLNEQKKTNYVMTEGGPQPFLCDSTEKWNADIQKYNKACAELLSARGIRINDLYSVIAADTDKYLCDDGIHPSAEGVEALARKVASGIKTALEGE